MPISRVASQSTGGTADSSTSVSLAYPGNVTEGNVLVIRVTKFSPNPDAFVLGDISKSAGTSTLGSFTMDVETGRDIGGAPDTWDHVAIYSAPVTGTGSCTIQVGSGLAASYWFMALSEYYGMDRTDSRVSDTASANAASGAPSSGAADSVGYALFAGMVGTDTSGATTHTVGVDFYQIAESENGAANMTGSAADRIVIAATNDAADWTQPTTVQYVAAVVVYRESQVRFILGTH